MISSVGQPPDEHIRIDEDEESTRVPRGHDSPEELRDQYRHRFHAEQDSRNAVWRILIDTWFDRYLVPGDRILDLGCGWGHFINQVDATERLAIDLNPDAATHVDPGVELFEQRADETWPVGDDELDVVFTSNFLEHLPDRSAVIATLTEANRCLRPGGRLICLGPNVRYTAGAYWDFFDHIIPLSERSLAQALDLCGFEIESSIARFLPFTMAGKPPPPPILVRAYLRMPLAWRLLGRQFLVVARAS